MPFLFSVSLFYHTHKNKSRRKSIEKTSLTSMCPIKEKFPDGVRQGDFRTSRMVDYLRQSKRLPRHSSFFVAKSFDKIINIYFNFSLSVLQLEISIRLILPQRFLYFLYVISSILLVLCNNCSHPSVSLHSLREISNFESISALLCP